MFSGRLTSGTETMVLMWFLNLWKWLDCFENSFWNECRWCSRCSFQHSCLQIWPRLLHLRTLFHGTPTFIYIRPLIITLMNDSNLGNLLYASISSRCPIFLDQGFYMLLSITSHFLLLLSYNMFPFWQIWCVCIICFRWKKRHILFVALNVVIECPQVLVTASNCLNNVLKVVYACEHWAYLFIWRNAWMAGGQASETKASSGRPDRCYMCFRYIYVNMMVLIVFSFY